MPLTPEQRAENSRRNGAKSKGPTTPEGKEKSARNSIHHGRRAEALKHFAPPHFVALCNEDRREFNQILDEITNTLKPKNDMTRSLVRDIAVARWSILRLEVHITNAWNFTLLDQSKAPLTVTEELGELEVMFRSAKVLFTGQALISRLEREIDRYHIRIARLERTIRTLHANYKTEIPEQTHQPQPEPVENTETEPESTQSGPPIYVTENTPKVLEYYKTYFPGRRIIVLPADDVANGIDHEDDMPDIPRKVA